MPGLRWLAVPALAAGLVLPVVLADAEEPLLPRASCRKTFTVSPGGLRAPVTRHWRVFGDDERIVDETGPVGKYRGFLASPERFAVGRYARIDGPSPRRNAGGEVAARTLPAQMGDGVFEVADFYRIVVARFGEEVRDWREARTGDIVVYFVLGTEIPSHVAWVATPLADGIVIHTKDRDESVFSHTLPYSRGEISLGDPLVAVHVMSGMQPNSYDRSSPWWNPTPDIRLYRIKDRDRIRLTEDTSGPCDLSEQWGVALDERLQRARALIASGRAPDAVAVLQAIVDLTQPRTVKGFAPGYGTDLRNYVIGGIEQLRIRNRENAATVAQQLIDSTRRTADRP